MIKFELKGLDELRRSVDKLQRDAAALDGTKVTFAELFNPTFMRACTRHASIGEWFSAGGFNPATQEELELIPPARLDEHVRASTRFTSWDEMKAKATEEYVAKRLFR